MGKTKQLIKKENFEIDGNFRKAICSVEIYEKENGRKEIILSPPEGIENYCGGSTANFFERFATEIKKHYLANTLDKNISWVDRLVYIDPETFPTKELRVLMDFDGIRYSNPNWRGRSHEKFSLVYDY